MATATNENMKQVRIPPVEKKHGQLALGCWAMGGSEWGGQSDSDSLAALREATSRGVNHIDTAEGYGSGHSEEVIGRFIKEEFKDRDKLFLATKGFPNSDPGYEMDKKLEKSLRRLQTDYVDLYYFHWPREGMDLRPLMERLEKARGQGKIKAIGVSNFTVEQMESLSEAGQIDAHQLGYNLFWRYPQRDTIPYCIDHDISVVTYSSLAEGTLTGKFPRDVEFEEGDHRKDSSVFFEENTWPKVYEGVEKLKELAAEVDQPVMYLGLQWLASRVGVTSVLVGARNGEQARQNAGALADPVSDEILHKVDAIGEEVFAVLPDTGNIFRFYP